MQFFKKSFSAVLIITLCSLSLTAQEETVVTENAPNEVQNQGGRLSGSLESNVNFFMRDSVIGAFGTPQYERQQFGADTWLNLNYNN